MWIYRYSIISSAAINQYLHKEYIMPHMKKPAFRMCTMVLLLAAVPQGAWADDGGDSQSLPNVSVTAPRRVRADRFYTVDEMSSATGMKLAPKNTP